MNTLLQTVNLHKTFHLDTHNDYQVLKDVNLRIARGDFVSIMGPSGSGKSTLLYNMCGMDTMTSGTVHFNGTGLQELSERQLARLRLHEMGFVFQQIHLLENLSILDNIVIPGFLSKRRSRKEVVQRATELMERTGIEELGTRSITQASGGQLQRVGICRALINEPEIVFGDEPTGALNSQSSTEILDLLTEINSAGTTILLVTHDVRVAARTHRVLLMKDGELVSERHIGAVPDDQDALVHREEELSSWLLDMGV